MRTKNCAPASLTRCKHCSLYCRRIRQLPDGVPTYTLIVLMSDGGFDRNNLIFSEFVLARVSANVFTRHLSIEIELVTRCPRVQITDYERLLFETALPKAVCSGSTNCKCP